jgi:hypothetical protein
MLDTDGGELLTVCRYCTEIYELKVCMYVRMCVCMYVGMHVRTYVRNYVFFIYSLLLAPLLLYNSNTTSLFPT